MVHANARLTPRGRLLMVERVEAGTSQSVVAKQMGVSRGTVSKWYARCSERGVAGLQDRSSRPRCSPRRAPAKVEQWICCLRQSTRRGPAYLSAGVGVAQSTIWRVVS